MAESKKQLLFPKTLKPGDTIGIVAPASHFNQKTFDKGLGILEGFGFCPFLPKSIYAKENYLAGSDRERAETINRLFADPDVQAIACARGGYGSMRMLRFLDWELIRTHPKTLVGFSDVTALLWALYSRCRFVTLHGPTVTTLGKSDDATLQSFSAAISGNPSTEIVPKQGITLRSGIAQGPVTGGNLTTLCHLIGTEFQPVFKGQILFLEDRGELPYRIDRMLTQMRLAGCLDHVAGVMLGTFVDCGSMGEVHRIVMEFFGDLDVPVLSGFDMGHGERNLTLPLGVTAELDADRQALRFAFET